MAAKKAAKKAGAGVTDRCNNGLPALTNPVRVAQGADALVAVEICGSPAVLHVSLDGETQYKQEIVDSFAGHVSAPVIGQKSLLMVTLIPTAPTWRAQVEVSVNGAVGFRFRKDNVSDGSHPRFVAELIGVA